MCKARMADSEGAAATFQCFFHDPFHIWKPLSRSSEASINFHTKLLLNTVINDSVELSVFDRKTIHNMRTQLLFCRGKPCKAMTSGVLFISIANSNSKCRHLILGTLLGDWWRCPKMLLRRLEVGLVPGFVILPPVRSSDKSNSDNNPNSLD